MNCRLLPLFLTLPFLPVHALEVLVDFNEAAGSAGAGWNVIAAPTATFASQIDLDWSTGGDSGLNIGTFVSSELDGVNTNMPDSGTNTGVTGYTGDASWVTNAAGQDYFFGGNAENSVGFTLTGLVAGQEYTVDLFASHNASRTGDYAFRLVSDTNPTVTASTLDTFAGFEVGNNVSSIMSVTFTPGSGQALQITGFADDPTTTGTRFNALRVTTIPEPSTLLLVGGALGALALFRRRR